MDNLTWWQSILISAFLGAVTAAFVYFYAVPKLRTEITERKAKESDEYGKIFMRVMCFRPIYLTF